MISTINGNALSIPLCDNTVQCVITSPPYWGLRDYGVSGQLGLESIPQAYISNIVAVMRECWRVMRDDATLWLIIGDSYCASPKGNLNGQDKSGLTSTKTQEHSPTGIDKRLSGLKPKNLIGIPWRVAFALQDDGWYLRSDIIWSKPNPMPESVTDRPTKAHEYIFLLAKQEKYYYDAEAIKESGSGSEYDMTRRKPGRMNGTRYLLDGVGQKKAGDTFGIGSEFRNRRSVWTVATQPYSGAHFATFPPALIEPMILAGSRPGDIVLDPFAGTSTVGRVCAKHGRKFIGVELNPDYIELAEARTSRVQIEFSIG